MNINILIRELARARQARAKAYDQLKELEDKFHNSEEYRYLAAALENHASAENDLDTEIRNFALPPADTTGPVEKHPHPAVELKAVKTITIKDESAAITWCRSNFTPALALNKKVFEAAVKAGTIPADLATLAEAYKAYIASDLSKYLEPTE